MRVKLTHHFLGNSFLPTTKLVSGANQGTSDPNCRLHAFMRYVIMLECNIRKPRHAMLLKRRPHLNKMCGTTSNAEA